MDGVAGFEAREDSSSSLVVDVVGVVGRVDDGVVDVVLLQLSVELSSLFIKRLLLSSIDRLSRLYFE